MGKIQLSLDDAKSQAEQLLQRLQPACHRIQVAGSIRRHRRYVGDIEIVALPRLHEQRDLFDVPTGITSSWLDLTLGTMIEQGAIRVGEKWGPRFKQFTLPAYDTPVDLFITNEERWGTIFTIRTGSADFVQWLVTARQRGGALPAGWKIRDGILYNDDGHLIYTPEERDVFQALGLQYIEPPRRERGYWNQTHKLLSNRQAPAWPKKETPDETPF